MGAAIISLTLFLSLSLSHSLSLVHFLFLSFSFSRPLCLSLALFLILSPSLLLYFSLFLSLSCSISISIYAFGENDSGSTQDRRKSAKFCYPAHPPAVTHLVGTPVWWAETNFPTYPPHQSINKFAKLRRCASRVSFGLKHRKNCETDLTPGIPSIPGL